MREIAAAMVVQFAALMGAWCDTGSLWMAAFGGALAIWVTFTPCFVSTFLGALYAERLRRAPEDLSAFDPAAAALGLVAIMAVFRLKAGAVALLSVYAPIGIAAHLSGYGQ